MPVHLPFQLTTSYQDIIPTESRQPITRTRQISQSQNQHSEEMAIGKNYTFLLSAKTCSGIRPAVQSVGQCITAPAQGYTDAVPQSDDVASIALGVLVGLSLLSIAILVSLYFWR